jgi:hypothetical protein
MQNTRRSALWRLPVCVVGILGPAVPPQPLSSSMRSPTWNILHAIRNPHRMAPLRLQGRHISASARNLQGKEDCDIVIAGGGPAGLALASALGAYVLNILTRLSVLIFSASSDILRSSLKITLVEGGNLGKLYGWDMLPDAFSNRVVSLTNSSLDFLDGTLRRPSSMLTLSMLEIGAWARVDMERTCPIEDMQVQSYVFYSISSHLLCIRSGMVFPTQG